MAITLAELLEARDNRRKTQIELIASNPGKTLVVMTVNIPGPEKQTADSVAIGKEGVRTLMETFLQDDLIVRDLYTGFEAFLLVNQDKQEAKKLAMQIEDTHPLGRLMDIDVFNDDATPISRNDNGRPSRRCLVCGGDARVCMRTFAHPLPQLTSIIHSMVNEFFQQS